MRVLDLARLTARLLPMAAAATLAAAAARAQAPGERLPKWSPGTLDIHHINTGRGNAIFFVLPDGTTLLLDAGDGGSMPPRGTPQRPDASRTPAEWIAPYVEALGVRAIATATLPTSTTTT